MKRIFDFFLGSFLFITLLPVFIIFYILLFFYTANPIQREKHYKADGTCFLIYNFKNIDDPDSYIQVKLNRFLRFEKLKNIPVLLNIIKGDMSFVGPRSVNCECDAPQYVEFAFRPGLTCLYQIRVASNIAHETQEQADLEYMQSQSIKGDIGILLRSLVVSVIGKSSVTSESPDKIKLLDIEIDNMKMSDAVDWIITHAKCDPGRQVAFVNPDCFNISFNHPDYKKLLQTRDKVFGDGIGIHYACKMLNLQMRDNVNGTDMFPYLCQGAEENGLSVYFLGGRSEVVSTMVDKVLQTYPRLMIAGSHHGYYSPEEEPEIIEAINRSSANILFVAFGAPRQELWIDKNLPALKVGVAIGVGGLFDFVSERIPRAPRWMREIGLEWVYRLMQEPGRMWRRYIIGNPLFLWRVYRWKKSLSHSRD